MKGAANPRIFPSIFPWIFPWIFRWIHIICSIPIIGYIYSPFDQIPNYAPATRFVFLPVMLLSGLWMWKGHLLRRLVGKRAEEKRA